MKPSNLKSVTGMKPESVEADAARAKAGQKRKSSNSIWYYTCEGDRLGPVTFEELRAMVANSSLDPRLDMIWRKSMEAWKPAGQIDGLFERKSVPVELKQKLTQPAKPGRSLRKNTQRRLATMVYWPGARRRSLLLIALVFPFAWQYALSAGSPFLAKQLGPELAGKLLNPAELVPVAALVCFGWKRLANLGMSQLWCLAFFAPVLNLWVGYRCCACPAGYAYHGKMDGPGMALAVLYWLIMISVVLFVSAFVALLFGAIDSPVMLEQFRGWIRPA